jgi:putative ABC transport system permease protein
MFLNYLKIAWRKLLRHKAYSFINILGLSIGICICIAIFLIVNYELSFDRFHPGKDRIYRVMGDVTESTGDKQHFGRVPFSVSVQAHGALSGVDVTAGIIPYNAKIKIAGEGQPAKEFESRLGQTNYSTTVIAEPQYFRIFKYHWLAGNANTALNLPLTVVLAESKAKQYFGDQAPDKFIGKQVVYDDSLIVTVSGIIKDWDKNSDLLFTDFISAKTIQSSFLKNIISFDSWNAGNMRAWVFAKLSGSTKPAQVERQMAALVTKHGDPETKLALWLEPLSRLHFNSDVIENPIRTAHMPTLYSLMAIALFILILAIINFINLSTAHSIQRAKEVGVRKVLGSNKRQLVAQFLTETLALTFFSELLAVILVNPLLAAFDSFIPAGVSFHITAPSTIIFLLSIMIIVSFSTGLYPAKQLSSYMPVESLKGGGIQRGGEAWLLRKGLIVFQFTVSIIFIIGSIVIAQQLKYTRDKDLGFTSDAIVTAETPRGKGYAKVAIIAQKIRQIPGVKQVALQWVPPMTDNARGMKLKFKNTDEKDFWVTQVAGSEDFIPLYQIKLLAGRSLQKTDSVNEFVINESLSQLMGDKDPQQSLGKLLYWNDKPYPVVGVVADFHTSSLHDPITPLCIINRPDRESALAIKLASTYQHPGMIKATISEIKKVWKEIYPDAAFDYRFYDESLALLYEKDRQAATLVNASTGITIFISCMGLLGLTLFATQKRAKEISIRKLLGATVSNIVLLLSKDFLVLIMIALLIASPVAWFFMNHWLQDFSYRISINGWVFILAGITAMFITLSIVGLQAVKAGINNPIKNLRRE